MVQGLIILGTIVVVVCLVAIPIFFDHLKSRRVRRRIRTRGDKKIEKNIRIMWDKLKKHSSTSGGTVSESDLPEEILELLRELETGETPTPASPITEVRAEAMCYSIMETTLIKEYICPECGEKTLYPNGVDLERLGFEDCRREFGILKITTDLEMALDDSFLCSHCSPGLSARGIELTVTYPDGTTHKIAPVFRHDLRLLRDFFLGNISSENSPLKYSLPRVRALLGIRPTKNRPGRRNA